jgi:hypothetical protein
MAFSLCEQIPLKIGYILFCRAWFAACRMKDKSKNAARNRREKENGG